MDKATNEKIAELLFEQTFAERMEMARYFSDAVSDWISEGHPADHDYFATLIEGWADAELSEDA